MEVKLRLSRIEGGKIVGYISATNQGEKEQEKKKKVRWMKNERKGETICPGDIKQYTNLICAKSAWTFCSANKLASGLVR